jgi:hypothetical protein
MFKTSEPITRELTHFPSFTIQAKPETPNEEIFENENIPPRATKANAEERSLGIY